MEDSYSHLHRSTSRHGYKPTEGESPYGSHSDGKCSSKLQAENEYMKERVKSCERGLMSLYQVWASVTCPQKEPRWAFTQYLLVIQNFKGKS